MSDAEPVEAAPLAEFRLQHPDLLKALEWRHTLAERVRIREVLERTRGLGNELTYQEAVWPIAFDTGGTPAEAAQVVLRIRRQAVKATEKVKATLRTMTPAEALEARLLEEREEAFAAGVAAELRRAAKVKQEQQRAKRQRQAQRRKRAAQEQQPGSSAHQPGATA